MSKKKIIQENNKAFDYLHILKAILQIPFCVGKKLLLDFLCAKPNESITRNKLFTLNAYGSLELYEPFEVEQILNNLIKNDLINYAQIKQQWKVLTLTEDGINEISNPTFHKKINPEKNKKEENLTIDKEITEQEKTAFLVLDDFLGKYNNQQKKSIISNKEKILCIAGAGTGKTTVLIKRIEFLIKYKSVKPRDIMAITFTRKARDEMLERLSLNKLNLGVNIHTFNSFCEKQLNNFNDLIYSKPVRVINYKDKIKLFKLVTEKLEINLETFMDIYYSRNKINNNSSDKLIFSLINDCYSLIDIFKVEKRDYTPLEINSNSKYSPTQIRYANLMLSICKEITTLMTKRGLRTYSDQLIDTINFFKTNSSYIKKYNHILVDEFQDINNIQMQLLSLLNPRNIFCVGDPRQSIYGWRSSKIEYILNFQKYYPNSQVISLTKNYRSNSKIVNMINQCISFMDLDNLESGLKFSSIYNNEQLIKIKSFTSKNQEIEYIIKKIMQNPSTINKTFVLARTNKQLREFSEKLQRRNIIHSILSEDTEKEYLNKDNILRLGTVHAVKGLQARIVFVIGSTPFNFPCQVSDNPILDILVKTDYDIDSEEKRLFYVALSRAQEKLYITYTGKYMTNYITESMKLIAEKRENNQKKINYFKEF
jgi:superfamily I DNA/RNA helicase